MTAHESTAFSSGQDCGMRVAACVARLAAVELVSDSHWWNRRRRQLMANALVACAAELESTADGDQCEAPVGEELAPAPRPRPSSAHPLQLA